MEIGEPCLPPVVIEAFGTNSVINENGCSVPLASNVSKDEAERLYSCVRSCSPINCAEVGFAQGISSSAILQALSDAGKGTHHVMDPFQSRFGNTGLATVRRAGLDKHFKFYEKFAEEVFPTLPPLQFVFIDASHLFDFTLLEFSLADKKLEVGGFLAFHDMWMPSLQKVIRYILANRAYSLANLPRNQEPTAPRSVVKTIIRWGARLFPQPERLFRPEFLIPWHSLRIPNLVFLKKEAHDQRDWTFHADF